MIEFSGQKGDLSLLSPLVRKMQYLIKYSQANSEIFPSRESFVGGGIGEQFNFSDKYDFYLTFINVLPPCYRVLPDVLPLKLQGFHNVLPCYRYNKKEVYIYFFILTVARYEFTTISTVARASSTQQHGNSLCFYLVYTFYVMLILLKGQ